MRFASRLLLACALSCLGAENSGGVIHLDTGDPTAYTSTPGDNSGWQYEGIFGGFLGTPISPHYFLSAGHIGRAGDTFVFHGATYTVLENTNDPSSDLNIWHVQETFPVYAPLFQPLAPGNTEKGQELHVFGRGTQRGDPITVDGTLRGWAWGPGDGVQRWGRNIVTDLVSDGTAPYVEAAFDSPGLTGEAHLSAGDSGGGLFILQNGLWRLAGINYGVDDLFIDSSGDGGFAAAIFNSQGYYTQTDANTYTLITDPLPTNFYSTQVSARYSWIQSVIGTDADLGTLPTEKYEQWLQAYFTLDQIADGATTADGADPDGDGVPNLLEFAFNLDPTFAEPAIMIGGTGVRGLPLIQVEAVAANDQRLTVEFVRRTATSGAGLTYAVQFTQTLADPASWQTGGTEVVTAINERWERVKVTDTVSLGAGVPARFARVLVTRDESETNGTAYRSGLR